MLAFYPPNKQETNSCPQLLCQLPVRLRLVRGSFEPDRGLDIDASCPALSSKTCPDRAPRDVGGGDAAQLVLRRLQPTGHLVSSPCYAHSLVWEVETFSGIQHFFFNFFCKPGCIETVGNIGWCVILYCLSTYRNRCTETQRYHLAGAQRICTCWKITAIQIYGDDWVWHCDSYHNKNLIMWFLLVLVNTSALTVFLADNLRNRTLTIIILKSCGPSTQVKKIVLTILNIITVSTWSPLVTPRWEFLSQKRKQETIMTFCPYLTESKPPKSGERRTPPSIPKKETDASWPMWSSRTIFASFPRMWNRKLAKNYFSGGYSQAGRSAHYIYVNNPVGIPTNSSKKKKRLWKGWLWDAT